jgi:NAD(P) transhydrogenase
MLDMFKRKTDPDEHNYLYAIPALTSVGCLFGAYASGMGYLSASLCCIGGISGLAA